MLRQTLVAPRVVGLGPQLPVQRSTDQVSLKVEGVANSAVTRVTPPLRDGLLDRPRRDPVYLVADGSPRRTEGAARASARTGFVTVPSISCRPACRLSSTNEGTDPCRQFIATADGNYANLDRVRVIQDIGDTHPHRAKLVRDDASNVLVGSSADRVAAMAQPQPINRSRARRRPHRPPRSDIKIH
jgi:hypothetical protein